MQRFNVWPPRGQSLPDHVKTAMRDWLVSFAPENADTLLVAADVAAWVEFLDDFSPIQHDAATNTTDQSIKIGKWKRFDVYVERGQTPGFGAFMWGLDCNMDAAFELFEESRGFAITAAAPEV